MNTRAAERTGDPQVNNHKLGDKAAWPGILQGLKVFCVDRGNTGQYSQRRYCCECSSLEIGHKTLPLAVRLFNLPCDALSGVALKKAAFGGMRFEIAR